MSSPATRSEALRHAFDASFARPLAPPDEAGDDLLAVHVAGAPYAIRLADIGGVVAHTRVTALPAGAPGLLGLAGIRGEVAPVFDLSHFTGGGGTVHRSGAAWWVLDRGREPLALAFEALDAFLRVPRGAMRPHERPDRSPPFSYETATTDRGHLPVLAIPRVFAAIRAHASGDRGPNRSEQR